LTPPHKATLFPYTTLFRSNGLKVVMAVINNWDLKDENNAIYRNGAERIYMVSDLGASFGTAGRGWPSYKGKGNLDSYRHSKFLRDRKSTRLNSSHRTISYA